jgi:hypothetical protein
MQARLTRDLAARRTRAAHLGAVAAATLVAGCGNVPLGPFGSPASSSSSSSSAASAGGTAPAVAAAAPDTSPALPTAVHVVTTSSDGLAGFFPFEGTSTTSTRADRRREESTLKGTSAVSRFVLRNTASATITRLDSKLVYALDIPRAEYTECPLGGCPRPATQEPQRPPQQEQPRSGREPDCTMRVASNNFDVKPTSQRKSINGFDTEQYAIDWTVALEDPNKRRSTLKLTADVWTSAVTPAMREAMNVEASYARAAAASMERNVVLPPQFMDTVNRYLAQSMTAADRAALFNIGRQMERIKGQPILTQLRFFFSGNACGGADEGAAAGGAGASAGIGQALSSLIGGRSGGGSPGADKPLFGFTTEVKSWRVEPVRDSQFAPPANFKRTNPR